MPSPIPNGLRQANAARETTMGYQAMVVHGDVMLRKMAARGSHSNTVHNALISLLEVLARVAAAKVPIEYRLQ
jgi:hypothetical protein